MRTNKLIKIIIIFQIIFCLTLIFNIYNKKNNVLDSKTSISPIKKENIKQAETDDLKYYYDLIPNQISTDSASFLSKPITYKYNNDGLNDLNNYSPEKPIKTYRIIALGDSFTYGLYVETNKNWTELLENKLNENKICKNIDKFEILNFGVSGYDPQYEVELYKRKGQKYNPDLIIWMLTQSKRINNIKDPIFQKCLLKFEETNKSEPYENYCINKADDEAEKYYDDKTIQNIQTKNISLLSNFYNKNIFFIDYYKTHSNVINESPTTKIYNNLLIDIREYKYSDINIKNDNHPNELGHKLIADIIYKKLFELNQIPCQPL